uniref:Nlrc5 protein n=1 Tax=Fopius arisanus TaxID=64838 RepID=A0A0C9QV65_9HYME
MTDEGVHHVRLGRSRLLQKEELMYGEAVYHQKPIVERHRLTPRRIDSPRHPETLSHPNNGVTRRQPKPRIKYQRQTPAQYSSSDESAPRLPNKSKSTSSIDTQSVNNILDEFEDLDGSGTSNSSISVTNFESMMNNRRKQRAERQIIKVNQQTQVRQRSRDRGVPKSPDKPSPAIKQVPEILLRKGEVQKRVDEWLIQSQTQQTPTPRVSLTRSTSSADQKRKLISPEARLNGTTSCDDLNCEQKTDQKVSVSVGVNTGPLGGSNYREYPRNRMKIDNDTGAGNLMTSRIPQRQGIDKNSRIKYKQSNGGRLTSRHSFKRTRSGDRTMPNKAGESRPARQNKVEEIVQRVETAKIPVDTDDNNSRRPPAPPRRNHRSDLSSCSSFKPNKTTASAPHYARDVEKIYEMSLRPEVIHADDLRAVLEPSAKSSAYGESSRDDSVTDDFGKIYPDIGLDQCIRIQRRLPKNSTFDRRDFDGGARDKGTDESEPTYETLENVLKDSYEAMSTLKLDRHLADMEQMKLEVKGNDVIQKAVSEENMGGDGVGEVHNVSDSETKVSVNEVLVKNLCFHQDIPSDSRSETFRPVGVTSYQKPFNFNSVLSDDYEARVREASNMLECKIYVTKEEMERQRLMDLLRKRDYEAVKLELERSYTLSTPGGGSPVCCPPCSPPPAPAAYISSIRASSRKFGGSGPTSPDRDPVGRLLRYLKMYYRELGTRDPRQLPPWILPLPLGTLCPAHFQPHLQLMHKSDQEHRLESIKIDQIFSSVRLSDGLLSEAPRRVAIEGGPGSGRTTLCMRLLHQWASKEDGPALAFIIPLRELRGTSLLTYLTREFLTKSASLTEAMAQVWRTLHLLEDRVLFILDGYDECPGGRQSLADAVDLLEARLFPDARIIVTCSPNNWTTLSPMVQRRIHLAGLEWSHVERLCVAYFIHNNLSERACDFLECLSLQSQTIKQIVQHPLGWLMLCTLYQDCGTLPSQPSAVVQEGVKSIIRRCLDRPLTPDEELPSHCRKRLEDFGKLSLAALREGRCCYTESEIRTRGGGVEIVRFGFLSRGFTFGQRRKVEQYTPIHTAVAEFFAAYYLASISQYANILRREIEGLPSGIIGYLAGLLGPRTHLVLNQLCPLEVPSRTIFSLLKAAGTSDGNILAVCRLLGAAPGFGPVPNERPPAPLVQTSPLELEGWAKILGSDACTLEALEVVFQVERGADPTWLNDFFNALADNESVRLVRITSLLGQEFPADEAQRLAGHLKSVLGKKRLNDFELVITCLEEAAHDRLECVVNALCRGLSNASAHLARLVLDMNLSGEQVSRVCTALRDCVQVQALHLPHLSCGCEGLASVAELLKERPLLALNLAGSWGAKNEDPSSSGISMGSGSGSGSSGCASSTLGTLPLNNRCYSSLPRGALAAYGSLTRPATLPRLPLGIGLGTSGNGNGTLPQNDRDRDSSNGSSKRNSDSVLCHRLPMHPLPTCDVACHQGTGFHEIFNAIREQNCKLRSLNVSKCLQGGLDAGCLGETIRRAKNLDAVRAAGASRPVDVMPLVLALTEAPCLQLLDLASPRLAMDDHPSRLLCHALARNSTLRLLSLEGWTFRIEESDTLSVFSELLTCTSVRELSLCNARLHLAVHEGPLSRLGRRDDAGAELLRAAPPPACPTIVFLRLAGFQVSVNDRLALRGPLLLPFLTGFTALSELDLSLDKSEIGGSSGSLLFIDDKILQQFFTSLSIHLKSLQTLKINYWRINLEDTDKTMRQISKHIKTTNISFVKANGLIVTDSVKRQQVEHLFVQTLLGNLQWLTWLCIDGVKLTESQCTSIGKWIKERYPGVLLEISAKDIQVKSIKALVAAVEEGGRADVGYIGGSTCRIKINKLQKNSKTKKK